MNEAALPSDPPIAPDFKDRRTGLRVFGILEILCGALAGLMIPLMLLGQIMSGFIQGHAMANLSLGTAIAMLAYLLFVRRYFRQQGGAVSQV